MLVCITGIGEIGLDRSECRRVRAALCRPVHGLGIATQPRIYSRFLQSPPGIESIGPLGQNFFLLLYSKPLGDSVDIGPNAIGGSLGMVSTSLPSISPLGLNMLGIWVTKGMEMLGLDGQDYFDRIGLFSQSFTQSIWMSFGAMRWLLLVAIGLGAGLVPGQNHSMVWDRAMKVSVQSLSCISRPM